MLHVTGALEKGRVTNGQLRSKSSDGANGFFFYRRTTSKGILTFKLCLSDGMGWEHASISLPNRCPTWEEMCLFKTLLWDPEDVVVQYHPRESEYRNLHPFCLHLWRPIHVPMPTPPPIMVAP